MKMLGLKFFILLIRKSCASVFLVMLTKHVNKIVACRPLSKYRVWIRFDDGLEGEVDLNHLVGKGVFKAWDSVQFFNQVRIDPRTNTLAWGDDIDLDPYVLRDKIIPSLNPPPS